METDVHKRQGRDRGDDRDLREPYKRRRCLVPATHFFEWTGPKGAKEMWRFSKVDAEIFCFAGLWDRDDTADGPVENFTILTCAPGADCEPYHNRQPVILEQDHWAGWLDLSADPSPILRAGEANTITIERFPAERGPAVGSVSV